MLYNILSYSLVLGADILIKPAIYYIIKNGIRFYASNYNRALRYYI
jgi:hypothetical protein